MEHCCHKQKIRAPEEQKKLLNRLNRIEGQVRGLKAMLEKDAYCVDILMQVSAATAALNAFSRELLSEHIQSCVVNDIKAGREDTVQELVDALQKLMK